MIGPPLARAARFAFPLLLAAALSACGQRGAGAPWTTTDSAGIRLVSNEHPEWKGGRVWRVDSTPSLALTPESSGPEARFTSVAAIARFPDGRVAVADGGTGEVRIFGPDGQFLAKVTPAGGKAEATSAPEWLWAVPPDTLVMLDNGGRLRRASTSGKVLAEDSMAPPGGGAWGEVARMEDGSFVGMRGTSAADIDTDAGGLQRPEAPLVRLRPGSSVADTLGSFPGLEVFVGHLAGRLMLGVPPLARRTVVRADSVLLLTGTDDGMSYDVRRPDGTLVRRVRIAPYDLSGADTMAARIREEHLKGVTQPAVRRLMEAALEQIPTPSERPAYSDIQVAPDGHVWVGKHRGPPVQMPPDRWEVFDARGRWLGTVVTPEGFRVLGVGDDAIVGTAGGGRQVEVLSVVKGGAG